MALLLKYKFTITRIYWQNCIVEIEPSLPTLFLYYKIEMDFDLKEKVDRIDSLSNEEIEHYSQKCSRHFISLGLSDKTALQSQKEQFLLCKVLLDRFKSIIMEEIDNR